MSVNSFYKTAKAFAEKIKKERPFLCSESNTSLCLLMTNDKKIFTGLPSIRFNNKKIEDITPEENAITAMLASGQTQASQIVVISFNTLDAEIPCDTCFDILLKANPSNKKCIVVLSLDSSKTIEEITTKSEDNSSISEETDGETVSSVSEPSSMVNDEKSLISASETVEVLKESATEPLTKPETTSDLPEENISKREDTSEDTVVIDIPSGCASKLEFDTNNPFFASENAEPAPEVKSIKPKAQTVNTIPEESIASDIADNSSAEGDSNPQPVEEKIELNRTSLTKEELKRQAKEMKKAAKRSNNLMKRLF